MKTNIGVRDAGDSGGVPNSGAAIGVVTVEDGDVAYNGDVLSDDERDALEAVSDLQAWTGGGPPEVQSPGGEPLTNVQGVEDASHEDRVNEVTARLRSMGYVPNVGE